VFIKTGSFVRLRNEHPVFLTVLFIYGTDSEVIYLQAKKKLLSSFVYFAYIANSKTGVGFREISQSGERVPLTNNLNNIHFD
jgi:hypothetical protein